eukprot:10512362-Ditylum_brightwellii.AAC.1
MAMALELGKTTTNQQGKTIINQQHHLNTSVVQRRSVCQWGKTYADKGNSVKPGIPTDGAP